MPLRYGGCKGEVKPTADGECDVSRDDDDPSSRQPEISPRQPIRRVTPGIHCRSVPPDNGAQLPACGWQGSAFQRVERAAAASSRLPDRERLPADRAVDVALRMRETLRVAQSVDVEPRSRARPGRAGSRGRRRGSQRRAARSARLHVAPIGHQLATGVTADDGDPNRRPVVQQRLPMVPRAGALRWGGHSDRRRAVIVPWRSSRKR